MIQAGDTTAAFAALDRLDKVTNLRMETIERADKLPGGWGAATIFERMAQTEDANAAKLDRVWKAAASELESKKSADHPSRSYQSSSGRGEQRGGYRFSRSVFDSWIQGVTDTDISHRFLFFVFTYAAT